MTSRQLDEDKLRSYSGTVWSYKQGEMVSMLIQIGDRLVCTRQWTVRDP